MLGTRIIDLTHELHTGIPTWDLTCGFQLTTLVDYQDTGGEFTIRSQSFDALAGAGTHMDAPAHFIPGAATIKDIPVDHFLAPCVVIDVSDRADEQYKVSVADIELFEEEHGQIQPGALVIFYTGWSRFWDTPQKYHNNHKFPSVATTAAQLLVARDVVGIAIDTLSPDCFGPDSYVHTTMLGAQKYIIENVANADKLPAVGAVVVVLPLKMAATESPVRMIAWV